MYLTSALEAFTRNGGAVEALPSLGDAPVELAPHYVDPSWCPAELVTLWLALGDALFDTEDQYWLRVKLVALFGLRPPAAALAVPSNFGHCGRGLQMCVLGEGAKANPYVAGASPRALSLSGFSPEQLEPLDLDTQAILRAMRDRATTVDAAMERRGLPRFPGDVLYRLRHARVRDLCEAMAPGEEWEIQVLLGHYDATSMYDYALLSPQAALEGDLYEPQPSQTKQSPAPWQ